MEKNDHLDIGRNVILMTQSPSLFDKPTYLGS